MLIGMQRRRQSDIYVLHKIFKTRQVVVVAAVVGCGNGDGASPPLSQRMSKHIADASHKFIHCSEGLCMRSFAPPLLCNEHRSVRILL